MNDPVIAVDPASSVPMRRQILERVRQVIVEGGLATGDELPSARRLATDLGVHFNTVAEAYRMLAEDGWLAIEQGRRARVISRAKPPAPTADTVNHFRGRLRQLIAEMRARGLSPAKIAKEFLHASEGLR